MASGQVAPGRLVIDDRRIYWASYPPGGAGAILALAK
jgi:hypothetical protein